MDDFSGYNFEQNRQANIAHEKRMQIYEYLQSPLLFVEWLMKFNDTEEIGNAGRNGQEPFAKYLKEKTNQQFELIDNYNIYFLSMVGNISLPGWATQYLKRITKDGNGYGDAVNARDCLAALEITK